MHHSCRVNKFAKKLPSSISVHSVVSYYVKYYTVLSFQITIIIVNKYIYIYIVLLLIVRSFVYELFIISIKL